MKEEDIKHTEQAARAAAAGEEVPKQESEDGHKSQSTVIVELLSTAETWHTSDREPYIGIPVDEHVENLRLEEHAVSFYAKRIYYQRFKKVPQDKAVKDAIGVLQGKALFESPELPVHIRIAQHEGSVYVDLANEKWQVVKITADGWEVISNPPIKFRRPRGMLALPTPERGGTIEELRPFLNVGSENDFKLAVGWEIAAHNPQGPYVVLAQHGEQGSAKSTNSRVLRSLIDPNKAPMRPAPRETRDLAIAADNSWVAAFDNLSYIKNDLSDDLCRLATGGSFGTRRLYSGRDEELFDAQRPIIFNGIEEAATRSDLIDRLIILYLPSIPVDKRLPEKKFWGDFTAARPRILGALYDGVATALRNLNVVKLENLPRMADAAQWVSAAEPAFGWPPDTFVLAYAENHREVNHLALESSVISDPVRELVRRHNGSWEGTASDLKSQIEDFISDEERKDRRWPRDAKSVSGKLRRIAPNLRAIGYGVDFWRTNDEERTRMIALSFPRVEKSSKNEAAIASEVSDMVAPPELQKPLLDQPIENIDFMGGGEKI